jgi:nitrogen fixation protein NifU and related proteins
MTDVSDLYQELILDHNARPRNSGELPTCTHQAEGLNPLCGDTLRLCLEIKEGIIRAVKFAGSGCAISTASTSLMTTAVQGRTTAEAERLLAAFHELLTGPDPAAADPRLLGKLMAFAGVRRFPSRVKCATLAWHTLDAALHERSTTVSTE